MGVKLDIHSMVRNQVLNNLSASSASTRLFKQNTQAYIGNEVSENDSNVTWQRGGVERLQSYASQRKEIKRLREYNVVLCGLCCLLALAFVIMFFWNLNLRDSILFHNYEHHYEDVYVEEEIK